MSLLDIFVIAVLLVFWRVMEAKEEMRRERREEERFKKLESLIRSLR
jgi:hypothetical protein